MTVAATLVSPTDGTLSKQETVVVDVVVSSYTIYVYWAGGLSPAELVYDSDDAGVATHYTVTKTVVGAADRLSIVRKAGWPEGQSPRVRVKAVEAIDADLIVYDYVPTNYTRTLGAPSPTDPATAVDQGAAHLKGIDAALGTNATAAATALTAANAHGARHLSGGADEVDGDKVDIDRTGTNYTPATDGSLSTETYHLTSHLKGIDTALGTLTTAVAAAKATTYSWRGESMGAGANSTNYFHPYRAAGAGTTTTIGNAQMIWGRPGTIKNLRFMVFLVSGNNNTGTLYININGTDTAVTIPSVHTNTTSVWTDLTHSVAIAANDLFAIKQLVGSSGMGSANWTLSFDFVED